MISAVISAVFVGFVGQMDTSTFRSLERDRSSRTEGSRRTVDRGSYIRSSAGSAGSYRGGGGGFSRGGGDGFRGGGGRR